jgi:PleD family two-component response regulator
MLNSNHVTFEGPSLLIVDDDKELCQVVADILREKGYVVEVAHDGKEAGDKLQERFCRVALIDIKLPDMEGTELLRRLKEMHPETDAIMTSAYATLKISIEAIREGAFAYVLKPLAMDEVIATAERALEKRHLAMETRQALTREREDKEYYRLLSITDGLTKVYNRRHLEELLAREIALAKRYRYDLSLLMIDLDHFKGYNDTYGHLAGDRALRQIAKTLKGMCREVDPALADRQHWCRRLSRRRPGWVPADSRG